MRVLVTGCHGFVGHYVCEEAVRAGHHVVGTERLHRPRSNKSERMARAQDIDVAAGDISDAKFLKDLFDAFEFDAVVHCAAQFPIKHTTDSMESYLSSNLAGFLRLIERARVSRVMRFVYTSSLVAATGGRPSNLYGATKRFNEEAAHVFACHGMETIGVRLAQVYGPMMRRDAGIWKLGQALKDGLQINHRTGFGRKREQVHVRDAAKTIVSSLTVDLPERNPVVLACADDFKADYGDIVKELARAMCVAPSYPDGYKLSPRVARNDVRPLEALGLYVPRTSLEEGMREMAGYV